MTLTVDKQYNLGRELEKQHLSTVLSSAEKASSKLSDVAFLGQQVQDPIINLPS